MSRPGIFWPVIYILTVIVISSNSYAAAILQTTSDVFSFEGGGGFFAVWLGPRLYPNHFMDQSCQIW